VVNALHLAMLRWRLPSQETMEKLQSKLEGHHHHAGAGKAQPLPAGSAAAPQDHIRVPGRVVCSEMQVFL
jgi:hypothetical protein